jgi:hypothetical protein
MATLIKIVMSGLIAATALAVVGTSADAAFSPTYSGIDRVQVVEPMPGIDNAQLVQKVVWSQNDQKSFWEQEGDRGG